jgi:LAS superfamily LD-carboxypeptidase LdcB
VRIIFSLYVILQLLIGPPLDVLVDSQHGLPEWYEPGENRQARQALEAMVDAAEADGLGLAIFSGYRSYDHQVRVYAREARKWPERVDGIIAQPGHSEHQLGTAFDIAWPGLPVESLDARNVRLFEWVEEHSHEFGFVLSYPLKIYDEWPYSNRWRPFESEIIYEPWHVRYVGVELATEMMQAGYLDPESDLFPKDFYRAWP